MAAVFSVFFLATAKISRCMCVCVCVCFVYLWVYVYGYMCIRIWVYVCLCLKNSEVMVHVFLDNCMLTEAESIIESGAH